MGIPCETIGVEKCVTTYGRTDVAYRRTVYGRADVAYRRTAYRRTYVSYPHTARTYRRFVPMYGKSPFGGLERFILRVGAYRRTDVRRTNISTYRHSVPTYHVPTTDVMKYRRIVPTYRAPNESPPVLGNLKPFWGSGRLYFEAGRSPEWFSGHGAEHCAPILKHAATFVGLGVT